MILSNRSVQNFVDTCIHSKFIKICGVIICLCSYDMLIFYTNMLEISEIKKYLTPVFKMKDLDEVDTILGINFKMNNNRVTLSQIYYTDKTLSKFNHLDIEEYKTLDDSSIKFTENAERITTQLEYESVIGSRMNKIHYMKSNITFFIGKIFKVYTLQVVQVTFIGKI